MKAKSKKVKVSMITSKCLVIKHSINSIVAHREVSIVQREVSAVIQGLLG